MSEDEPTGILIRLSVDRDGKAESPDRHLADCRSLLAEKGWHEVDVYLERDVSGRNIRRPEFERLVNDLKTGRIKNVIAWDWSRITRRGRKAQNKFFDAVDERGGILLTYHQRVDTSTEIGKWIAEFYAMQARGEAEATSRRVGGYMADMAKRGTPSSGGPRSFGYTRHVTVKGVVVEPMVQIPEEVAVIRWMADQVHQGTPKRRIATMLNERGVTTSTGAQWSASSVFALLKNPRLAGIRVYRQGDFDKGAAKKNTPGLRYEGAWEGVFTEEEHNNLLEAMRTPASEKRQAYQVEYLASGRVRCGLCGARMRLGTYTTKQGTKHRYTCYKNPGEPGCGKNAAASLHVDAVAAAKLLRYLEAVDQSLELTPVVDSVEVAKAELARRTERLKGWDLEHAKGELSQDTWLEGRKPMREAEEKAKEAIAAARREQEARDTAKELPTAEEWAAASPQEQKRWFSRLVIKVTIHPTGRANGGRFNPERVSIDPSMPLLLKVGEVDLGKLTEQELEAAYQLVGEE